MDLAERIAGKRMLVCGDYILDIDIHGTMNRFAQESPGCPVFAVENRSVRAGGAGAVEEMVSGFGALSDRVCGDGFSRKSRFFVGGRQVWRQDDDASPPSPDNVAAMVAEVDRCAQRADVVLIADYGKMGGAAGYPIWRAAIDGANARGIPVIVDPAHGVDWRTYRGTTAIKCNEAGGSVPPDHQGAWWGEWTNHVIVTSGENGIEHMQVDGTTILSNWYRARPSSLVDVTGAGDCVLAALGVCLAAGLDWPDACRFAAIAAGLKVERHGAVAVPLADVLAEYELSPSTSISTFPVPA